jgi:mono/diheme cytochrome c family protein
VSAPGGAIQIAARLLGMALPIGLLVGVLLLSSACASRRIGPPVGAPPVPRSTIQARGREVFLRDCHACHPDGGAGLGPSIVASPLPLFLVGAQVRVGLGAMPAFHEGTLSEADLDALLAWVRILRTVEPPARTVPK